MEPQIQPKFVQPLSGECFTSGFVFLEEHFSRKERFLVELKQAHVRKIRQAGLLSESVTYREVRFQLVPCLIRAEMRHLHAMPIQKLHILHSQFQIAWEVCRRRMRNYSKKLSMRGC